MFLQKWIHHIDLGGGARVIKNAALLLGFVMVATFYDLSFSRGFISAEAMETAQLARNLAQGKGYTTSSIRPLALFLLQKTGTCDPATALRQGVPDLTHPPVYPVLLAGLMKVLPLNFTVAPASEHRFYQPEVWITVFNQFLFFVAVLLLFTFARRLFDSRVAWTSAGIFAATELYWRFSVSGLSLMLLVVIFLGLAWCLLVMHERNELAESKGPSLLLATAIGILVALGAMTSYAFGWLIIPVLMLIAISRLRNAGKFYIVVMLTFAVLVTPWLVRNYNLSGNLFGTAGYSIFQETVPFPGDRLERSLNPQIDFSRVDSSDYLEKLLINTREIVENELPKMGGNWLSAFFLVGLLVPFRNAGRSRLREFLVLSLLVLVAVQALGKTHISHDLPVINSENLLAIAAPLVFVFGTGFFFTLLEGFDLPMPHQRVAAAGVFGLVMTAPLLILLVAGVGSQQLRKPFPPLVQKISGWVPRDGLMMSDIPAAVAWYGQRNCVWLTLDDNEDFYKINKIRKLNGLYLTEKTTDSRFLTDMVRKPRSWEDFVLTCWARGEVPSGFPLKKAPLGLLPVQVFLSDEARWKLSSP